VPEQVFHQPGLNGGELSDRMTARSDLAIYGVAANRVRNFIPTIQGPAEMRPGTRYVRTLDPNLRSRVIHFRFSRTESFCLEFSSRRLRIYRDFEQVQVSAKDFRHDEVFGATGTFFRRGHGFHDGQRVQVSAISGSLPAWLSAGTVYYVRRLESWKDNYDAGTDRHTLVDWRGVQTQDVALATGPWWLQGWLTLGYPGGHGPNQDYYVFSIPSGGTVRYAATRTASTHIVGSAGTAQMQIEPQPDAWYDQFRLSTSPVGRNRTYQSGVEPTGTIRITPMDDIRVQISTPYDDEDLWEVDFAQAEDVMILTHPHHMPRVLKRLGDEHWELEVFRNRFGPYEPLNEDKDRKLLPVAHTSLADVQQITLINDAGTLTAWGSVDLVGRWIRARHATSQIRWAEGRILSVGSSPKTLSPDAFRVQRCDATDFGASNTIATPEIATWQTNEEIRFFTRGHGTLPNGLLEDTTYYAIHAGVNLLQVSLTPGGPAVPFTAFGFVGGGGATGTDIVIGSSWLRVVGHAIADDTFPVVLCTPHGNAPEGVEDGVAYRLSSKGADFFQLRWHADSDHPDQVAFPQEFARSVTLLSYEASTSQPNEVRVQFPSNHQIVHDDAFSPSESNVTKWRVSPWSPLNGWPASVGFVEQRLVFGNIHGLPSTIWASESGLFDSFSPDTKSLSPPGVTSPDNLDRSVGDANSWTYSLVSGEMDAVTWIEAHRFVAAATLGRIFQIRGSGGGLITPTSREVSAPAADGSLPVKPARSLSETVYISSSGRVAYALISAESEAGYIKVEPITHHADHALASTPIQLASSRYPWFSIYVVREDGRLYACVLDRSAAAGVNAWYEIAPGGTDVVVESCTVIASADGGKDELWLVVRRSIGGTPKRFLEVLTPRFEDIDSQESPSFLDASVSTFGPGTITVLAGLSHLEGETIQVVADGDARELTVVGGQVTLWRESQVVHGGLGYEATIRVLPVGGQSQTGQLEGVMKRWVELTLHLHRSRGGKIRLLSGQEVPIRMQGLTSPMDTPPELFTGQYQISPPPEWNRHGQIEIVQDEPYPMRLLAFSGRLEWSTR
jgi:hypothetical protein